MKFKKTSSIIQLLVVALLLLASGYALFNQLLVIGGTANTTGNFDIQFFSAIPSNTVGATPEAIISTDKKTLTINVNDLQYPGAGTQIDVTIRNVGNISAILRNVTITGADDPDIIVNTAGIVENVIINPNEDHQFTIMVYWVSTSTTGDKNITFNVDLLYEQNTTGPY